MPKCSKLAPFVGSFPMRDLCLDEWDVLPGEK
jgi:hypothetical protein